MGQLDEFPAARRRKQPGPRPRVALDARLQRDGRASSKGWSDGGILDGPLTVGGHQGTGFATYTSGRQAGGADSAAASAEPARPGEALRTWESDHPWSMFQPDGSVRAQTLQAAAGCAAMSGIVRWFLCAICSAP